MKTIKEKAEYIQIEYDDITRGRAIGSAFVEGANYVIGEIENFMRNLNLGNDVKEKFCKLDVIADISAFIDQLKGE